MNQSKQKSLQLKKHETGVDSSLPGKRRKSSLSFHFAKLYMSWNFLLGMKDNTTDDIFRLGHPESFQAVTFPAVLPNHMNVDS